MTPRPELQDLRQRLRDIYAAMATFGSARLAAKPPILDLSMDLSGDASEEFHSHQDAVQGLRALRDAVRQDLDVLEKFLNDPACKTAPPLSTNAPYLISVWNEVLHARPPIVTIWRTFPEGDQQSHVPRRGSRKPPGVKVDVVAEGGRRWVRVNTTKNSRLLAEFREIDSYQTESEDSEDEEEVGRPSLSQKEFDNSILRIGRSLLDAAHRNPLAGTNTVPSITLRLTRLDPSPSDPREHDPRIAHTLDLLCGMGIDVEFGERDPVQLPRVVAPPIRHLEPTIRLNLDLSILIALVSDLTHSSLPTSAVEADARYVPSVQYREWKRKRLEATNGPDEEIDEGRLGENGLGKHSRALANQALQEMNRGLLHELRDRLAAVASPGLANVEFWTTPEAGDRCLRIVLSKIGGRNEKRRAAALFSGEDTPLSEAEEQYWAGSRYPRVFLPLIPIRVFDSSVPGAAIKPPARSDDDRALSPFFEVLARTCRDILAQETIPDPRTLSNPRSSRTPPAAGEFGEDTSTPDEDETAESEIERAAVTKANPRLSAHTVQSMLWGAARGWTTLTANKSSVKAILRDIRAGEGGGGYGWDREADDATHTNGESGAVVEKAVLWVVDPRSLAEGMRSDYVE